MPITAIVAARDVELHEGLEQRPAAIGSPQPGQKLVKSDVSSSGSTNPDLVAGSRAVPMWAPPVVRQWSSRCSSRLHGGQHSLADHVDVVEVADAESRSVG